MTRLMKHNPAFLDDDELIAGFTVRRADFELLVETLHENIDASANQHVLVIGPRGMGKTTLVRRVAVEVRRDAALSAAWYPIVFGEESYTISDAGEFWLEAILHLADALDDPAWHALHDTLLAEPDGEALRVKALARLTDFAESRGVRLLLVVENLQMVLGEQLDADAASSLRHTLQNEPRIMLLGTAASRFDAIEQPEQPMFDLLRVVELDPLDEDEARALWDAVAERPLSGRRIRPVHILTGGNPRLLSIVAAFSQKRSFAELMTDLVHLVDDHTTYFKANVEALPPGERKVLVALADLWSRATSRQVAERARLEPKKTSAYLKRLSDRGVVREVDRIGRVRLYELTERLYNIYHLMRRRGGEQAQVKALVEFMIAFYDTDELGEVVSSIASEACAIEVRERRYHLWALAELMGRGADDAERKAWLDALPAELFEFPDMPPALAEMLGGEDTARDGVPDGVGNLPAPLREVAAFIDSTIEFEAGGRRGEAPTAPGRFAVLDMDLPSGGVERAAVREVRIVALFASGEPGQAFQEALALSEETPRALATPFLRLVVWAAAEVASEADVIELSQRLLDVDPSQVVPWLMWGLGTSDMATAERALRQAVDVAPRNGCAWAGLGWTAARRGRPREAAEALQKAIRLEPDNPTYVFALAWVRAVLGEEDEALAAMAEVLTCRAYARDVVQQVVDWVVLFGMRMSPAGSGAIARLRNLLHASASADAITPIIVALDMQLGRPVRVPREVEAVAGDIVARLASGTAIMPASVISPWGGYLYAARPPANGG